jgi:hypothetical protein
MGRRLNGNAAGSIQRMMIMMLVIATISAMSACGSVELEEKEKAVNPVDKVTTKENLTLTVYDALLTDQEFSQLIAEPAKNKYPKHCVAKIGS